MTIVIIDNNNNNDNNNNDLGPEDLGVGPEKREILQ